MIMPVLQMAKQIMTEFISVIAKLIIAAGIIAMPQIVDYGTQIQSMQIERAEKALQEKIQQEKTLPAESSQGPSLTPRQERSLVKETPSIPISEPTPEKAMLTIPTISLTELNTQARKTIVNILCATKTGGSFNPITGSGVIVSPKGPILTTAHIGQYFLLENEPSAGFLNCVIRTGDVAQMAYDARLLYIPPSWIEKNAESITKQEPKGTGEDDFAFLLINKSLVQGKELPASPSGGPLSFSFSEPNFDFGDLPTNLSVLLASYPAGFLGGMTVQTNLGLTSTFADIKALYTFSETGPKTLDLFSLGGNIVAQGGSSGGGVFDTRDGKLIGLIVTSTSGTTTASRELNVITMPHIKRSFEKYTGQNLAEFLANPESFPNIFAKSEFNRLKNLLVNELEKR